MEQEEQEKALRHKIARQTFEVDTGAAQAPSTVAQADAMPEEASDGLSFAATATNVNEDVARNPSDYWGQQT